MIYLVDTSVLIDFLRGVPDAVDAVLAARTRGALHASEITRLEVLAGMRPAEEGATRALLSTLTWHPVSSEIAERAGALGRAWLPRYKRIDATDLAIAATAQLIDADLLTTNIKHFPMIAGLTPPY
jgi:predicted nucleic acid-binding protein